MRLSFINIQNLIFRNRTLDCHLGENHSSHWLVEMDQLMEKIKKGKRELQRIEELTLLLGFQRVDKQRYGILRNRGGQLYLREGIISQLEKSTANSDWQGWMKINSKPVHHIAFQNKIRLMAELNSDLIILQEVEDKYAVLEFQKRGEIDFISLVYPHTHVVEGCDPRGLEQACLHTEQLKLNYILPLHYESENHIAQVIHYDFWHKEIGRIAMIAIYLYPSEDQKDLIEIKRKNLMTQIGNYYRKILEEVENVAIVGGLNAPGYCYSLAPLLRETNLMDISTHPNFQIEPKGNSIKLRYPNSAVKEVVGKKDFFLLSPNLSGKVKAAGLIWSGRYWPDKSTFRSYPSITNKNLQGSDHPALWIEL